MTSNVWRLLIVVGALIALGACGDDAEPRTARTVDVDKLTFADVQQRALAAVARPGEVFHLTAKGRDDREPDSEAWVDVERNRGRSESAAGGLSVFSNDRIAFISPLNGRFQDAAITSPVPAGSLAVHALNYLPLLFTFDFIERSLRGEIIGDMPVIAVEIETTIYESNDTLVSTIYLDESYLPVEIERRRGGSTTLHSIVYEFISPDDLPADFFSPDAVRSIATTPTDELDAARDAGLSPYWLGAQFEEMVLRDESRFETDPSSVEDGGPVLHLSYGPPGNGPVPVPCVSMSQYTVAGWQAVLDAREARNAGGDDGQVETASFEVPGGVATLYERPGAPVPPVLTGTPDPTQPVLPVVPDDVGAALTARVALDSGGFIEVQANCGPVGSNLYRTLAGFTRLLAALRAYDGPA